MLLRGRSNATSFGWSFTFWELISFKGLIVLELFFSFCIKNPYSLLNYNGRSSHLHKSIPLNYVNEANHTLAIRGNAANISSLSEWRPPN